MLFTSWIESLDWRLFQVRILVCGTSELMHSSMYTYPIIISNYYFLINYHCLEALCLACFAMAPKGDKDFRLDPKLLWDFAHDRPVKLPIFEESF